MCYTYDSLNRVTKRQVISLGCDCVLSEENYTYDAAGNITDAPNSCFIYDNNNRLTTFNGNAVSYDLDGNMLGNGYINCEFDSANQEHRGRFYVLTNWQVYGKIFKGENYAERGPKKK